MNNNLKEDKDKMIMDSGEEKMNGDDRTVERTSLCMVSEYNGQTCLYRLADINNINNKNRITSFYFNKNAPKVFDNRNRLYRKDGPDEIGYIGVWNWTETSRILDCESDYIESSYRPEYELIEVVILSEDKALEFVIEEIKRGYILKFLSPQIFFCVHMGNGNYEGVLCRKEDLVKDGNLYYINENVVSLPKYTIFFREIFKVGDRAFYKTFDMGKPDRKLLIKEISEVIKETFLRRASWSTMKMQGMNRNEWKQFKKFLTGLSEDSLYQEIAEYSNCSKEIAKSYVDDFVANVNKFIDGKDIDSQLLEKVIENNFELKRKCEEIVFVRWENENQEKMKHAKEKLQAVQEQIISEVIESKNKIELVEREVSEKEAMLKILEENIENSNYKLAELKNEIIRYEELGVEVKTKVDKQIEDAKKNAADFISEMAFWAPTLQPIEILDKPVVQTVYTNGIVSQNELDAVATWQELINVLSEELREAGIADDLAVDFAIYLYAANKKNMPILLAGPCGTSIANAFSMALYGKTAGILDCNKEYQSDEIDRMLNGEDDVVIIKNPFSAVWVNCIADLLLPATKQYFLLTPYAEDLVIEPNGLLNYMMPVLTEMLVDKIPTNQFVGGKMSMTFKDFIKKDKKVNNYSRIFKELKVKRIVTERWQEIIKMYHDMSEKDVTDMDYLMILLPCAYVTEQGSLLIEYMDKTKNLSNTMKSNIKSFLGVNK